MITWSDLKKKAENDPHKGDWTTYSRYVQLLKRCSEVVTFSDLDRCKEELAKILEV